MSILKMMHGSHISLHRIRKRNKHMAENLIDSLQNIIDIKIDIKIVLLMSDNVNNIVAIVNIESNSTCVAQ